MALIAPGKYARDSSIGSIRVLMRIKVLLYFQVPSVPTFHNRAATPSGTGSLRAWLRQRPFAAGGLDRAALFHFV